MNVFTIPALTFMVAIHIIVLGSLLADPESKKLSRWKMALGFTFSPLIALFLWRQADYEASILRHASLISSHVCGVAHRYHPFDVMGRRRGKRRYFLHCIQCDVLLYPVFADGREKIRTSIVLGSVEEHDKAFHQPSQVAQQAVLGDDDSREVSQETVDGAVAALKEWTDG